ncbi:MAG: isoprenylcysteine carboxylmethyltransferase family protein [Hyphomonadaceae bacterium]|nr:isoprenylcysteine carboxylmethyltransferase family protein [Hyphomonadaceae bacterium]
MPPSWLPLVALLAIIAISALRLFSVERKHGVKAFSFGRHAAIQGVAERNWKLATALALASALAAWLTPDWEAALGRPAWADVAALKWVSALVFAGSVLIIATAQLQMGASWRIGVPAEGPGALVAHGLFGWSRNPIFVGMIGAMFALFLWSPHLLTAAGLAATWTLALVQVRIEEEAMREKHGDAYERYAAEVGRWFGRRHVSAS